MKKIFILSLMLILLLGITTSVYAADIAKLNAKGDKVNIKPGETVVIKLSLSDFNTENNAAITGLTTKIKYDTEVFEAITQNDVKSDFLAIYNDNDNTHELNIASTSGIQENVDIAEITFRAKSNITSTSTTIEFIETTISGQQIANTPVLVQIEAEEIPTTLGPASATLEQIEISKKPTKTVYKIGEKFDPAGMEIKAVYSDGTSKVVTDYTYTPIAELKETDTKITITYKEGLITKATEQKITVNETGELPTTGLENYTLIIIAVLLIATISFIQVKKYNKI